MEPAIRYSVIVPTYDRVDDLETCLESLVVQTAKNFEVIIVDDCSGPETRAFVETFIAKYPHIPSRYVRQEKNGGHGKARNAGMAIARGEILLFTDDDCILPPEWVATHADAHVRYPEAAGVGGWYWPPADRPKNVFDRFYEIQYRYSYQGMHDCEVWTNTMSSLAGNTANMSYKTDLIRALNGFDEAIYFTGGIDWELKTRMIATGRSLVSIPLSVVHTKAFTLRSFLSKTIKLGRGMDYMASKYKVVQRPSLRFALGTYSTWKTNPVIGGECAWVALLWTLALIPGKWVNRLRHFRPREVFDNKSRSALYNEFEKIIKEDIPAVFIYSPEYMYILPDKIKGIEFNTINNPSDRLYNSESWYTETDKVWKIFAK
jgi:glycosyltransferase involved in cell wall biosynthesis